MSGGQESHEFKSHRPDLLTPLIDLGVWIQSDLGEAERGSIACGIASGVHDDEAQSIAFLARLTSPASAVPSTRRTVGAVGSSPALHSQSGLTGSS
jgi:hypothetical protein